MEFYISLVRNLIGYCIKIVAPDEYAARMYCVKYLGKMWCSLYQHPGNMEVIGSTVYVNEEGNDE